MNKTRMRLVSSLFCVVMILHCSYAPPVTQNEGKEGQEGEEHAADWEEQLEYHRYLKEVVQALESDADFKAQLEKADEDDIRSGKIAEQLDLVNHNVRTRLDEIKRRELSRLRQLATKQFELTNDIADESFKNHDSVDHLDHGNSNTFEVEDLKKLIKKVSTDLEVADQKRKEEFKKYEMEKEFQKHQEMEKLDEPHKKEYLEKIKQEEEARKNHKPLHHPGSKQQYEEVWEKQDNMDQEFDPKVFFMMHDIDGNGVWDADEVKALFIKELNKMYGPDAPVHDMQERAEEMERMREHVFHENDANKDGLVDFHEFMLGTKRQEFNEDKGWQPIEQNHEYSPEEYQEFEKFRLEELKFLHQRGLVDAYGKAVPGMMHQITQARQQFQAYYQQQRTIQHINQFQQPPAPAPGQPLYQQPPQSQGNQQYPQGNQQFQQPPQHQQYQQPPQAISNNIQQHQQPQGNQQYQQPQGNQQYQQQSHGNQQYQQPPQGNPQYQQPPQAQQPPQHNQQPPQNNQPPPQNNQQFQQSPQANQIPQGNQQPVGNQQYQQPPASNQQYQSPPQGNAPPVIAAQAPPQPLQQNPPVPQNTQAKAP